MCYGLKAMKVNDINKFLLSSNRKKRFFISHELQMNIKNV